MGWDAAHTRSADTTRQDTTRPDGWCAAAADRAGEEVITIHHGAHISHLARAHTRVKPVRRSRRYTAFLPYDGECYPLEVVLCRHSGGKVAAVSREGARTLLTHSPIRTRRRLVDLV